MHAAIQSAERGLEKATSFLKKEYSNLQIGRASPGLVESIEVEAYGSRQPLRNLAQVALPDARSIAITPWDKSILGAIEKAIRESNLKISPVNDGNAVRINIPPLTEERRKEIVKVVHKLGEDAKISIRQVRHEAHDAIKKDKSLSEDDSKRAEKELQEKVDKSNKDVEDFQKRKEQEVLTI
ncbi:ribosome recycling factor [Candidatus Peregrinibacteria bacterium]|nr:ribosome recycling factor [Candidatus Peregrinibacteria bacterium]